MNITERNDLIKLYKESPERLKTCLSAIPEEAFEYKPGPDRWSIHEAVVHIVDSDLNSLMRFSKAVAEPGSVLPVYDEDLWIKKLFTTKKNIDVCLNLLEAFRTYNGIMLDSVREEEWKNTVVHPDRGDLTLEMVLKIYANHILEHIRQIENTFDAWKKHQRGEYVDPDKSLIY